MQIGKSLGAASLLLFLTACGADDAHTARLLGARDETVFVSRTAKGAVSVFLNRLAGTDGQVVATRSEPTNASETVAVRPNPGEALYLVEPGPDGVPTAALRGEKARIGGLIVLSAPIGLDPHAAIGSHLAYAERLATDETAAPELASSRFRRSPARSFNDISLERAYLETQLKAFSGATPVTINGHQVTITERKSNANRANARAWLRQQYVALGFTVKDVPYGNAGGVNFVAERAGTDTQHFLAVTSHLDSVGNAGADDNGAGTIGALAIARALKGKALQTGLRVVAFDQEELGLLGSAGYAKQLNDQQKLGELTGVLNLEMIGYDQDNDGAFHSIDCDENTSATLTAAVDQALAADTSLRLKKVAACTNRSDHAAFWRYNRPAIVVSQNFFGGDDDPCYHAACDKVDNVNFDYMTRLGTLMARTVAALTAP